MSVAPIAIYEPIDLPRTVFIGSDQVWVLRRVKDDVPILPSSAQAQIRSVNTDTLWLECSTFVDPTNGWVHIIIYEADTLDPVWRNRGVGRWDLEVVVDGHKYRWAFGTVTLSPEVTK